MKLGDWAGREEPREEAEEAGHGEEMETGAHGLRHPLHWRDGRRHSTDVEREAALPSMHILLRVLFWVAVTGSVTSSIYCLMVVVAAVRFGIAEMPESGRAATGDYLPPLSRAEASAWD